jgi:hypothetical protein
VRDAGQVNAARVEIGEGGTSALVVADGCHQGGPATQRGEGGRCIGSHAALLVADDLHPELLVRLGQVRDSYGNVDADVAEGD